MLAKRLLALSLVSFYSVALGSLCLGGSPQALGDQTKASKVIKSKLEKHPSATAVDFRKAYGLSFTALDDLGFRIDEARMDGDPISLALLSNELQLDEKISGRKASLSSEELMKEAIEHAQMRHSPTELKALSLIVQDEKTRSKLQEQGKVAAAHQADRERKAKEGERGKNVGQVLVVNETHHALHIKIDGVPRGPVPPYGSVTFDVNDPIFIPTLLEAFVHHRHHYRLRARWRIEGPPIPFFEWRVGHGDDEDD